MSGRDSESPVRGVGAFIGARVFVTDGQYFTDSSLVYELAELARQFDEFFLHCFVFEGERARDELRLPSSVRLVQLGRVRSGRDLYGHPLRLLRCIVASARSRNWSHAVLAEPGLPSLLALLVCGLARRRIVALIRGDPAVGGVAHRHRHGLGVVSGWILQQFRMLVCWVLAHTVPVVADSDVVARRLSRRGADVHRVPAASVSQEEVLPPGPSWQGNGRLRVLFVGRLERVKDIGTLLDALHQASGPGRRYLLQVVGAGDTEYTALLHARVRELGLGESVEFTGPVAHGPDLYRYYQQAHVLALSSRSEGIPKVVIEAMAHGLPVIATRVGGLPGLVTPDTGILAPPGDAAALSKALMTIYDSPALAQSMGQAGQEMAAGLLAESVSGQLAWVVGAAARQPRLRLSRGRAQRRPTGASGPRQDAPMPWVSVAIPTRNRLPLLQEAVASVFAQDVTAWELLIVDDGSTDGTWPWLSSLADPRVRALRTGPPRERSAARNRALAVARAPYVLFVDDDDRLAAGALRHLCEGALRAPDAVAVIGRRALFDGNGNRRPVPHLLRARTRWVWKDVMAGWSAQVGTTLYRRDTVRAVGGWDGRLHLAQDQDLLLRVSSRGPVRLVTDVVLEQRIHPAQRCPEEPPQAERMAREDFLTRSGRARLASASRLLRYWEAGCAGDAAIAQHRYRQALRCYLRQVRICPAVLGSPLIRPRLAAQCAKAAAGSCLGRQGAAMARSMKARTRLALRRTLGEGAPGTRAPADLVRPEERSCPPQAGVVPSRWAGLRILLPGSAANLTVQGVLAVLGLFTGIITARVMGPALRGAFSSLVLVPGILTVIGSLGMEYGMYYFWHQDHGRLRPQLLAAGTVVTVLSGTLSGAVGFGAVSWLEPQTGVPLRLLVAASIPLSIANAVLTMALMAHRRVTAYNVSRLAGPVAYAGAVAALWVAGALGVTSAFLAWLASLLLTVVVDVAMIARSGCGLPRWDTRVTQRSVAYGLRSYAGTVAQYGTLRIDQVLLVALAGNGALGLYYAAVSLGEAVLQIANNIGSAMMAQLGGRPREEQRHLAMMTMAMAGLGTAVATSLLMAFGGSIITLLLGKAYLPGLPALRILLPGSVFLAVARMMNGYFIAVGEARVFAGAALASLAVTIVGDIVLIPEFQANGAALASTVAYGVLLVRLALVFHAESGAVPARAPVVAAGGDQATWHAEDLPP